MISVIVSLLHLNNAAYKDHSYYESMKSKHLCPHRFDNINTAYLNYIKKKYFDKSLLKWWFDTPRSILDHLQEYMKYKRFLQQLHSWNWAWNFNDFGNLRIHVILNSGGSARFSLAFITMTVTNQTFFVYKVLGLDQM